MYMSISIEVAVFLAIAASLIGVGFAVYQRNWVLAQSTGNEKMQKIARAIQLGAQAFLTREYRAVAVLVVVVTLALIGLSFVENSGMTAWTALAFVAGALASGLAGYVGMYIAVRANVRTTQAASESLNRGLRVAFASGTVMGTIVVSLALMGVSLLFMLFVNHD
jgi:K(+)-stimulated pyrophosphate-energized sodium pump